MNKEELMTLLMPEGTSHCSFLGHCFLFLWRQRATSKTPTPRFSLVASCSPHYSNKRVPLLTTSLNFALCTKFTRDTTLRIWIISRHRPKNVPVGLSKLHSAREFFDTRRTNTPCRRDKSSCGFQTRAVLEVMISDTLGRRTLITVSAPAQCHCESSRHCFCTFFVGQQTKAVRQFVSYQGESPVKGIPKQKISRRSLKHDV